MSKKTVVTIGVFDGVHLGHRKILETAVRIARRAGMMAIAVTFNPHPLSVLKPKTAPLSLISLKHRLNLIKGFGIDRNIVFNFTKKFAGISAESFVKNILVKRLNAGWVVVGEDFCFGKAREADCGFLKKKGEEYGFAVKMIKTLRYKEFFISSSLIRRSIRQDRLRFAEGLLGRPVAILGTVVKGSNRGRILGFPTANINPHHEVVPPSGVYAVRVKIDQKEYEGVLNIGTRPTFYGTKKQDEEPTIEVHIFNFSKRIYKKDIEAIFVKRLRPEKKFVNKQALIKQIRADVKMAKEVLCR